MKKLRIGDVPAGKLFWMGPSPTQDQSCLRVNMCLKLYDQKVVNLTTKMLPRNVNQDQEVELYLGHLVVMPDSSDSPLLDRRKLLFDALFEYNGGIKYTVIIPYAPGIPTRWHPCEKTGPFSRLTRGAFVSMQDAKRWADEHLEGHPFEIGAIGVAV